MALNNSEATERVLARAQELSRSWKHYYLGIEHIFMAACQLDGGLANALSDVGVSVGELEEGILAFVPPSDDGPLWDGMPETPRYRRLMKSTVTEEAEADRSLRIEPKHLVTAALREGRSVPCRYLASKEVNLLELRDLIRGVRRAEDVSKPSSGGGGGGFFGSRGSDKNLSPEGRKFAKDHKLLLEFGRDLTEMAKQGKIDPVIGRNDEVRRVLQVLTRKTKSNPVLVGEAGVGKTSVAYGLALRLAAGTVPDILKGRHLVEISLSSLVAGASHRGEFEKRLQQVMEELAKDQSVIIFIDEIHQIVGAGGSGGMDASNILKPALARGEIAVMGATTTDEYRRYIESDPALERRFQQVTVSEPSEEDTFEILRGLRERYERHHHVHFTDEALLAAVKLSVRFLPDRNLPDKAIDLIDEAAARIKTRGDCNSGNQEVDEEIISEVVADWTGIPVSRVANEEETRLLDMENLLRGRVVGQDHAVDAVASTIRVVRVGLSSPNRPGGVFLFLGPSGVGKTELAKTLAEFLFGSEREMIRLDMSEFHDKHSIARLIGAPPGYVGYEGEGQLTKAVRTKPFCVLLLDEVEKAHPDVFDLFLQVFDDGRLTDAKGRTVNFTNAIIIMTSNLGSKRAIEEAAAQVAAAGAALSEANGDKELADLAKNNPIPELMATDKGYVGQLDDMPEVYQAALRGHFRPEFLNRIDEIIIFKTLKREDLQGIVDISLSKSIRRIKENRQIDLKITKKAVDFILDKGYHPAYGARPLNRAIDTWLTRPFAEYVLRNKVSPNSVIWADFDGSKIVFSVDSRAMSDTLGGEQPQEQSQPYSQAESQSYTEDYPEDDPQSYAEDYPEEDPSQYSDSYPEQNPPQYPGNYQNFNPQINQPQYPNSYQNQPSYPNNYQGQQYPNNYPNQQQYPNTPSSQGKPQQYYGGYPQQYPQQQYNQGGNYYPPQYPNQGSYNNYPPSRAPRSTNGVPRPNAPSEGVPRPPQPGAPGPFSRRLNPNGGNQGNPSW